MKDKGAISIIVGRMKGDKKEAKEPSAESESPFGESPEGDEEESESDVPMELEAAAEDVLRSFREDDAAGLAESLKSFVELCKYED